ncbi:MAG TPA: threonine--tRNA ligase [Dehalococcoidia bacterium]|jgi:threonyl-tRNA synthetase|nr:threonine--tRNA ligase [Dehalococcoidia bacterium]|tara:strand:+ start:567 stop:2345 length:1779 start_codon:yes stop_codon:yes gene_type:complete
MLDNNTLEFSPLDSDEDPIDILRQKIRHSAAHVMADAVLQLFPEAKIGIGPATKDGFYYDFEVSVPFTPEDLETIESLMKKIIASNHSFERTELAKNAALEKFDNQPYKIELIDNLSPEVAISTFSHGTFEDLCQGPHVHSTKDIKAFKLLNIAGAYWRGNENNTMLQRIYGTAFENKEALEQHLTNLSEAEKRDHRTLGKALDLYSTHEEIGPGLTVWNPKGARLRAIIEQYWRDLHTNHDYEPVYSPHIGKANLWETSGHLGFYNENMYAPMEIDEQQYYLKPMNCPFHIMVYKSSLRSYRELPLKLSELGTVYRYERSGVLHGLMRVRGFTQDDAHIFCTPSQIEDEIGKVLDLTFELLSAFGFMDYSIALSTKPEKSVGEVEMWEHSTNSLKRAIESRNLPYTIDGGGGAFYGPKIDINIKDALDRDWQCTTIQFDFNLPERFKLVYQDDNGDRTQPYMIHRAIFGSIERFIGVLIEHYGGAFPVWLSPVQAIIIPISDRHLDYAETVKHELTLAGVRTNVDSRRDRMNAKIRDAQMQKIPYMIVMGDSEEADKTVSVRLRDGTNLGPIPIENLVNRINLEVSHKTIT